MTTNILNKKRKKRKTKKKQKNLKREKRKEREITKRNRTLTRLCFKFENVLYNKRVFLFL